MKRVHYFEILFNEVALISKSYFSNQVIQRRGSENNRTPVNFTRPWIDYKHGFGDLDKDFWYGNDNIHKLTNDPKTSPVALKVILEDFEGNEVVAKYSQFR